MANAFSTWVHSEDRDERRAKVLARKMDYLRTLMDDNSELGKMARENYYQTREEYLFVKPPEPAGLLALVNVDIIRGKIIVLSGLLTIDLRGNVKVDDESLYGPSHSAAAEQEDTASK